MRMRTTKEVVFNMNEIKNINTDYLSYRGSIKAKIMRGKKVYKEKVFHNNGRWPMFKHMAYSLSGQYTNADDLRPLVLALYSVPKNFTEEGKAPTIMNNEDSWNQDPPLKDGKPDWSLVSKSSIKKYANAENIRIGNAAMFMIRPEILVDENAGIGQSSVTYKFLIPFTQLKMTGKSDWESEGYSIPPINLACLYSKNSLWWNWDPDESESNTSKSQSETYGNPNAFFFVTDGVDGKLTSLLPKSITSNIGEYSLSIEWTLTFKSNSTYVSPEVPCQVTWIDNIRLDAPVTANYKWGSLPTCPFYNETVYNSVETIGNIEYRFAGWDSIITLVSETEKTYTATYWWYNKETGERSTKPVTDKI